MKYLGQRYFNARYFTTVKLGETSVKQVSSSAPRRSKDDSLDRRKLLLREDEEIFSIIKAFIECQN